MRTSSDSLAALSEIGLTMAVGLLFWSGVDEAWLLLPLAAAVVSRTLRGGWRPCNAFPWSAMGLFLATGFVAAWASYDPVAAQIKLSMILVAAAFMLMACFQREIGVRRLLHLCVAAGVYVAARFLATHQWGDGVSDLAVIDDVGRAWMAIRPSVESTPENANIIGGLLALLLPLAIAAALDRDSGRWIRWASCASAALVATTLILTSSRGAWLAAVTALGLWAAWRRIRRIAAAGNAAALVAVLVLAALSCSALLGYTWVLRAAQALPGADHTQSRMALAVGSSELVSDFPFTGGGLASFAGLYSQYELVTPYFQFDYAHNMYLDVAVEQGLFGCVALLGVFAFAGARLTPLLADDESYDRLAAEAVAASLLIVLLHGLIDDALYGRLGSPFLFVLPALAFRLDGPAPSQAGLWTPRARWATFAAALVVVGWLSSGSLGALPGRWHANLGAVVMAREQLHEWPSNRWSEGEELHRLLPARSRFENALESDPRNPTALYRSGLLALAERDHSSAVDLLEAARQEQPRRRGVLKNLGYALLWHGRTEEAKDILAGIPEAASELDSYAAWWTRLGATDLGRRAAQMASVLRS